MPFDRADAWAIGTIIVVPAQPGKALPEIALHPALDWGMVVGVPAGYRPGHRAMTLA